MTSASLLFLLIAAAPSLTFDEALALAAAAPEVQAEAEAAAARRPHDEALGALTANPQLSVTPGWRHSVVGNEGFDGMVSLSQSWSLAGLAGARRAAAGAEARAGAVRLRLSALSARLAAARAWLSLRALEDEEALLAAEARIGEELVERARRSLEAGIILAPDLAETEAHVEEIGLLVVDAEGRTFERRLALALAAGRGPEGVETRGEAPAIELPEAAEWPAWLARAAALPEAAAGRMELMAAEAREVEVAARAGWSLVTAATMQREPPSDLVGWLTLGVAPPWFERGGRERAQAAMERAQAAGRAARAQRSAAHDLALGLHEVTHSREVEAHLRERLIPALERAAALRERAASLGRTPASVALAARREALAARRRWVAATAERRWAEVKAWMLLAAVVEGDAA